MNKKLLLLIAACIAATVVLNPLNMTKADTASGTPQEATSTVQTLYLRVTAYASVPDETDDTPFITANGTTVHDGIVASNNLPFGTKIQIPALFGKKVFTVEDRMNKKYKTGIDIWMSGVPQALHFGANYANIVVLGTSTTSTAQNVNVAANIK